MRCGLPLGRLTFLRYSASASLAGVSGCSLMRWPLRRRLCIVVLHSSVLVYIAALYCGHEERERVAWHISSFHVLIKSAVLSLLTLLSFRFRWRVTSGSYVVNKCAVFFNRVESFQYLRDVKFSESMLYS